MSPSPKDAPQGASHQDLPQSTSQSATYRPLIIRPSTATLTSIPQSPENERLHVLSKEILVETLFYPLDYVRVLMQVGFEPLPRTMTTTIFGSRLVEMKANGYEYIKYIYEQDGLLACYKGLPARLCGVIAANQLSTRLLQVCGMKRVMSEIWKPIDINTNDEPKSDVYFNLTCRRVAINAASTFVAYPFQVVSLRMMASFVGKEKQYDNIFCSFTSVYRENGILGFYHGFIPRLIGDTTNIIISGVLAFYANKYIVKSKEWRSYTIPALMVVSSSITYPFNLISVCMAVNGSGLRAGNPPTMPNYRTWKHCWVDLSDRNDNRRGSSYFFSKCCYTPLTAIMCAIRSFGVIFSHV